MKVISWNIQHGGGRRIDQICEAIAYWKPDVLCLQEARKSNALKLIGACRTIGVSYHFLSETQNDSENAIFLAARAPIDAGDFVSDRLEKCHIIEAEIEGLTVLPVHFPQKSAQVPLFQALLNDSQSLLALDSMLIGDLNCGVPFKDSAHKTFANAKQFQALLGAGWIDLYRKEFGSEARDFTWISPKTKRGFRYDHALGSESLSRRLVRFCYDHTPRERQLSDHSALILELS